MCRRAVLVHGWSKALGGEGKAVAKKDEFGGCVIGTGAGVMIQESTAVGFRVVAI